MQRVRHRQLELVFAANPEVGRGHGVASGVPEAKTWLRQMARAKVPNSLTAEVPIGLGRAAIPARLGIAC